jgi:predicted ATPase
MNKVMITGGPHSGKTSIIKLIENDGYPVVHDQAYEIIKELNEKWGLSRCAEYRKRCLDEFEIEVCRRTLNRALDVGVNSLHLFFDYGVIEPEAFLHYYGQEPSGMLQSLIDTHDYDTVFFCEQLDKFTARIGTGRFEMTRKEAETKGNLIRDAYHSRGYATTLLPKTLSPEERWLSIKKIINLSP